MYNTINQHVYKTSASVPFTISSPVVKKTASIIVDGLNFFSELNKNFHQSYDLLNFMDTRENNVESHLFNLENEEEMNFIFLSVEDAIGKLAKDHDHYDYQLYFVFKKFSSGNNFIEFKKKFEDHYSSAQMTYGVQINFCEAKCPGYFNNASGVVKNEVDDLAVNIYARYLTENKLSDEIIIVSNDNYSSLSDITNNDVEMTITNYNFSKRIYFKSRSKKVCNNNKFTPKISGKIQKRDVSSFLKLRHIIKRAKFSFTIDNDNGRINTIIEFSNNLYPHGI